MQQKNQHHEYEEYETVIGLEIHIQLATATKLFSGASAVYGGTPNSQACIIDLGLPGVLPVLNSAAITMAVKFGLSVGANITKKSEFARKNYFYPDLPKGYQISQHSLPIVGGGGSVNIHVKNKNQVNSDNNNSASKSDNNPNNSIKRINITRAHLEEDSGKLLHESINGMSGIDFNRAGIPLLEIVSESDMRSAQEAVAYVKAIHSLVRYLGICDGNMQEGSLRCDVNVSVRRRGATKLGTRNEIKNLNSFRFIERAIEHEVTRQIAALERGEPILQETRLYDAAKDETRVLRTKEEALDYRYFPDPDLLPLVIDDEYIDAVRQTLPELPWQKYERFQKEYGLNSYDATILSASKEMAAYFEETLQATAITVNHAVSAAAATTANNAETTAKLAANWIITELLGALNRDNSNIAQSPITPPHLAKLVNRIQDGTISGKAAKEVFADMLANNEEIDAIIARKNLRQISNSDELKKIVENVITENSEHVTQYRAGKEALFGFLVGQVMKASRGKANPQQVNELLRKKLLSEN